jgi:hypothetical protein
VQINTVPKTPVANLDLILVWTFLFGDDFDGLPLVTLDFDIPKDVADQIALGGRT